MRFALISLIALFALSPFLSACGAGGDGFYEESWEEWYEYEEWNDGCGCDQPPPIPNPPLPPFPQPYPNEVEIDVFIYLGEGAPCDFLGWVVCGSENTPEDYDFDADYICEIGLDWGGDSGGIHRRGYDTNFQAYATARNNAWVEIYGLGTNGVGYYLGLFEVVQGQVFAEFSASQDVVGWQDTSTGETSPDWLSMPWTQELLDDLYDQRAWEVLAGLFG